MKTRKLFSILCVAMAIFILSSNAMEVMAATYGTKASSGTYTTVGSENEGLQKHTISKNSSMWLLYYTSKNVTDVVYHVKGHGDDMLEFSRSVSLSLTRTTEWSANFAITQKCSASVLDMFEAGIDISTGLGYGSSYARGATFTAASAVTRTIKDSALTGYYTRVPGYTFYKMKDVVMYLGRYNTFYFNTPYGSPVLFTIYSKDNANWSIY